MSKAYAYLPSFLSLLLPTYSFTDYPPPSLRRQQHRIKELQPDTSMSEMMGTTHESIRECVGLYTLNSNDALASASLSNTKVHKPLSNFRSAGADAGAGGRLRRSRSRSWSRERNGRGVGVGYSSRVQAPRSRCRSVSSPNLSHSPS